MTSRALKELEGLPGWDLVRRGVADLRKGRLTVEALLLCVGASRLRRMGVEIPHVDLGRLSPEFHLFQVIQREQPLGAHGRFKSLVRRLVSFERALEHSHHRRLRMTQR